MTPPPHAGQPAASEWVKRWSHLVPAGGCVLDVACGSGRHTRWFHEQNHPVVSVDRSLDAINSVANISEAWCADIEQGPWPLADRTFAAVVVTNYLWRPLMPTLVRSVAPGGVLIYETFAAGNETVGKPSRPDFLLKPGELLALCGCELRVIAYEDGFLGAPERFVQRIVAVRPAHTTGQPNQHLARYPLMPLSSRAG